jgi:hypothetical protein
VQPNDHHPRRSTITTDKLFFPADEATEAILRTG